MNQIVLIIFISLLISLYILSPIIRKYLWTSENDLIFIRNAPEYKNMIREKNLILNEIKDIDLDYGLEKLDEPDYKELREKYRNRAAVVLKKIENYEKYHLVKIDINKSNSIDEEIEIMKNEK